MSRLIEVSDLHYRYPNASAWALRGTDLAIEPGELVALAGPSACGKSTLALAVAGCLHGRAGSEWRGSVRANGIDVTARSLYENADLVGLVQQNPEDQFCTLTVTDEVAFGLENRCYPPREIAARIAWALEVVGAAHLADRQLSTLSGGEKQRVAIASILAARPAVVILDEPTSSLDPTATQAILGVLERLRRQEGLTLLIIEHKLSALRRFSPRIVTMAQGRVEDSDAVLSPEDAIMARAPSPPGDVLARLERMSYSYGPNLALDDVTLALHGGQIVAVMGDNGSGKSTLLRCLLGLLRPTTGQVAIFGRVAPLVSVLARQAGIVFQNPDHQLLGDTVWDDALMVAHNTDQEETVRPHVERLLLQAGLWDRRADSPWTLSYGQKRRLNLVAATAHTPELVLADEILIGQDPASAARLMRQLRTAADGGACVVIALHSLAYAERYADRALFFDRGCVAFDGNMHELRSFFHVRGLSAYLETGA